LTAFLKTIQFSEGTYKEADPYAVVFGYGHVIQDFSNHPGVTGEWRGKKLPDNYCKAAGQPIGCISTSAGAYQFIKPTWISIKKQLPHLRFDKAGQDEAVIYLIKQRGAYQDVISGNFETAVRKLSAVWASFPNAPYGQPTKSMDKLREFYLNQGGKTIN
jgi:muramidase (phage lysozyme)